MNSSPQWKFWLWDWRFSVCLRRGNATFQATKGSRTNGGYIWKSQFLNQPIPCSLTWRNKAVLPALRKNRKATPLLKASFRESLQGKHELLCTQGPYFFTCDFTVADLQSFSTAHLNSNPKNLHNQDPCPCKCFPWWLKAEQGDLALAHPTQKIPLRPFEF